ncbi:MAG: hypothetical protein NVSMB19_18390 [Vulcanimicrobiaceae bacterium]
MPDPSRDIGTPTSVTAGIDRIDIASARICIFAMSRMLATPFALVAIASPAAPIDIPGVIGSGVPEAIGIGIPEAIGIGIPEAVGIGTPEAIGIGIPEAIGMAIMAVAPRAGVARGRSSAVAARAASMTSAVRT